MSDRETVFSDEKFVEVGGINRGANPPTFGIIEIIGDCGFHQLRQQRGRGSLQKWIICGLDGGPTEVSPQSIRQDTK